MKAAYVTQLGKAENPLTNLKLGERPQPSPGPGEALVQVRNASLNHHDLWTLKGVVGAPITPPRILGCEASGVVTGYGSDVPPGSPKVGSEVVLYPVITCGKCAACRSGDEAYCREFGLLSDKVEGTFAEYVTLPARNLLPKPASLSPAETGCLGVTFLTAYRMLFTRAALRPGSSVLVQGAGGGVATAAIQLASAGGMLVFATSRDAAKRELALKLGALHVLETGSGVAKVILSLTDGRGVDAVIETVGEPTWKESMRAVRPGGAIVVAGTTGGANPPAELNRVFWKQLAIIGSTMGSLAEFQSLLHFMESAHIHPAIDQVYPLDDIHKAFEKMQTGTLVGKVVTRVSE